MGAEHPSKKQMQGKIFLFFDYIFPQFYFEKKWTLTPKTRFIRRLGSGRMRSVFDSYIQIEGSKRTHSAWICFFASTHLVTCKAHTTLVFVRSIARLTSFYTCLNMPNMSSIKRKASFWFHFDSKKLAPRGSNPSVPDSFIAHDGGKCKSSVFLAQVKSM